MKKLGKKRKHPPKDTTSQNKSSIAPIKKHNQKKIPSPLEESNLQNNNQINTQDKLNELSKNKQGLEKLKKYVDSNLTYDSIKFRDIIFKVGDVLLIQAPDLQLRLLLAGFLLLFQKSKLPWIHYIDGHWWR